jgi:hypothetical protein
MVEIELFLHYISNTTKQTGSFGHEPVSVALNKNIEALR